MKTLILITLLVTCNIVNAKSAKQLDSIVITDNSIVITDTTTGDSVIIVSASNIKDCDKSPEYYRSNEKQYSIEDDDMDSIVITDTTTGKICIID